MTSTLAEPAAPAETPAARELRIAERTDALCLKQILSMGRQSYILMPSVFFVAYLAVRQGAALWAGLWFLAWLARMIYVYRLVARLRTHPEAPVSDSLAAVTRGFVFAGVVAGGLMPVFFSRADDMVLVIVTLLVTIYGNTMMIASSGVLRAGLGYGVPTIGTLIVGWLWHGSALGFGIAAFLGLSFALSIVAIRSQRRALAEVVRVIDDNENLSAALARERDRSELASASKTRFFAAASHDLRQPLHALSINATTLDLVARRSDDALLKEVSQGIGSALRQSRGLLDGLLDISRLDANAVPTRMAACDVHKLLKAIRDEFAALAAQRGLTLHLDLPAEHDHGTWVLTDSDQLMRVLGNLVDNALKFTRHGGVVLSAEPLPHDRVQVSVSDTGPGIDEAESERVFEEFYQVGNPSRDRSQGLGLGLAIVRRTAVLLNATLTLTSQSGRGCTFSLSLPAAPAPPAAEPDSASGSVLDPTPLAVLLVDDEAEVLNSLCTYFKQIGWSAVGVATGGDALTAVNNGFRPDVIVMDYRLQQETGLEVIEKLSHSHGSVPVVVVTGDMAALSLKALSDRGATVLHKPVDGERLAAAVRSSIQRPVPTWPRAPVARSP
jgi:signal transduction histidine kinase/CheY-like chemotaxis protein